MAYEEIRIGVLVERRYLAQAQPDGMNTALQARGQHLTMIDPQAAAYEVKDAAWMEGIDLIVARGRSWALLCLLALAEARGVPTINSRTAIASVHNKAEMAVTLLAGKIPTPPTFLGPVALLSNQIPSSYFPLILKPIFGDNCRGLRIVHAPEELTTLEWPEPVALAQHYLSNDGYDLKLYGIGDEVWAVRKPSPYVGLGTNPSSKGERHAEIELLPIDPMLRDFGRRCGHQFNLELYGVDCIQTPSGPVVIEVNDFPNYTGVPDADQRLADYILRRVQLQR